MKPRAHCIAPGAAAAVGLLVLQSMGVVVVPSLVELT
jgi:hypothetical protein